jgi:beta-lactamase regulating signal transducer with metallopeptidase domain
MSTDFLELIARLAWTASWAVAAMLLARHALRRWFGAALAYQAWGAVPVVLLATALPIHSPVRQMVVLAPDLAAYASPALVQAGVAWGNWLLLAWTAGVLAVTTGFWRAHVAFVRSLGRLTRHEGIYLSELGGGPASFGLLRPKIVVPADFAERYSGKEQALILAHERVHIRRGDAFANSLQALLQCVLWFNPIVHAAASRFRFDQELACDAAVLRQQPQQRRTYADAMLKAQSPFVVSPGGISCHWHSRHPLKERILSLHQTPPAAVRRVTGRILVAILVCAGGYSSLAARAVTAAVPNGKVYNIAMKLRVGSFTSSPRLHVKESEPFKLMMGDEQGNKISASMVATAAGPGAVKLAGSIDCAGASTAHPVLITPLGQTAAVKIQEGAAPQCELDFVVSELPPAAAG